MEKPLGIESGDSPYFPTDVVGETSRTASGNIALRIGRISGESWEQVAYIVLTPFEAEELRGQIIKTLGA